MINLQKTITMICFGLLSVSTMAVMGPNQKITCETPRGAKVIVIENQKVSLSQPFRLNQNRAVASVSGVRTKLKGSGFEKILYHNGAKHIIHIEDSKSFSSFDDYLIIRSSEGHEMTYPLECN